MRVKFRKDPQMSYEVKGEREGEFDLAIIGWVCKGLLEECLDEGLPDVVDVAVYIANNK